MDSKKVVKAVVASLFSWSSSTWTAVQFLWSNSCIILIGAWIFFQIQVLFQFAHNGYAIPEEEWELRAVGSVPELGSWDPRCAPSLKVDNVKGCSSAILWLPQGKTVEYRMVLVSKHSQQDGVSTVLWEGKGKHTPYTRRINRRWCFWITSFLCLILYSNMKHNLYWDIYWDIFSLDCPWVFLNQWIASSDS